ncbi:MAG: bifunctional ornithine acetyltransferase/N-acetylglutamate synthase [Gammaproteobacteria bacterium RBG_16_51_14]|nr:MAG: bifunctional ornithine acetyltransferase/N-acetylglutamate synthase [Gammaproteobacteria bacterium RBG_16_51_14]
MAVGLTRPDKLLPIQGIRLSAGCANLYNSQRNDLALIEISVGSACAAVFTTNSFSAAPVRIARDHLVKATPRYCLINAGNANAGTGKQGIIDCISSCQALAEQTGSTVQEVLPFSTGVIGKDLPVNNICNKLPVLFNSLSDEGWLNVAEAIMTTDTLPKGISRTVEIDNKTVTVTGIAKGSGMIRPDMATMLAFIATDAVISRKALQDILSYSVNRSFNRICVDGDTSTNDACLLIATGASNTPAIASGDDKNAAIIRNAIADVCLKLAQAIVRDGEGASKFITVDVCGGASEDECLQVAYVIAESPLVKTAFYASDPNWGRILAAVGRAGLKNLDIDGITIFLDEVCIVENGGRASSYSEYLGQEIMRRDEITVRIQLARGMSGATIWTCDLSNEYVRINAEYRN